MTTKETRAQAAKRKERAALKLASEKAYAEPSAESGSDDAPSPGVLPKASRQYKSPSLQFPSSPQATAASQHSSSPPPTLARKSAQKPSGTPSDGSDNELSSTPKPTAKKKQSGTTKKRGSGRKAASDNAKATAKSALIIYYSPFPTDNSTSLKIILLIPTASEEGAYQRVSIEPDMSYTDLLETIHEVVGCVTTTRKPLLSYRFSSSTAKSDAVMLSSQLDWDGCLEDLATAEKKKKDISVVVKIIIKDEV